MGRRPPARPGRTSNGATLSGIWANWSCCRLRVCLPLRLRQAGRTKGRPSVPPLGTSPSRGHFLPGSGQGRWSPLIPQTLQTPSRSGGGQCACWARPLGPRAPTAGGTQAVQPVPLWPCAPVTTAGGGPPCAPESPESPVRSRRACTAWSAGRGAHEWAAVAGPGCAGSLPRLSQALLRPATAAPISAALTGLCSCSLSSPWEANLRKRASAVRSLSPWFLFWTGLGAAEQGELPRHCASRFLVAFCRETFNHTEFSL